jgi:hypothetical protein
VVVLEWGTPSLVSTNEELLERKSSDLGLEIRDYGRWDSSLWPCRTLHQQQLTHALPTSGGCLVSIVRSRTQVTEFFVLTVIFGVSNSEKLLKLLLVTGVSVLKMQPQIQTASSHSENINKAIVVLKHYQTW